LFRLALLVGFDHLMQILAHAAIVTSRNLTDDESPHDVKQRIVHAQQGGLLDPITVPNIL
jgi:hypothetical protein